MVLLALIFRVRMERPLRHCGEKKAVIVLLLLACKCETVIAHIISYSPIAIHVSGVAFIHTIADQLTDDSSKLFPQSNSIWSHLVCCVHYFFFIAKRFFRSNLTNCLSQIVKKFHNMILPVDLKKYQMVRISRITMVFVAIIATQNTGEYFKRWFNFDPNQIWIERREFLKKNSLFFVCLPIISLLTPRGLFFTRHNPKKSDYLQLQRTELW